MHRRFLLMNEGEFRAALPLAPHIGIWHHQHEFIDCTLLNIKTVWRSAAGALSRAEPRIAATTPGSFHELNICPLMGRFFHAESHSANRINAPFAYPLISLVNCIRFQIQLNNFK